MTGAQVLAWLERNADPDGVVGDLVCKKIAAEVMKPLPTVQHALCRLQKRGYVVQIAPQRYVVCSMAELDDIE